MKMFQEFWIEVGVALILATLAIVGKKVPILWRKAATRRFRKAIAYEAAKRNILLQLQQITRSKRVVLCQSHNDGGIPRQGHKVYITIEEEMVDMPLEPIKKEWQNRAPDQHHLQILLSLTIRKKQLICMDNKITGEIANTHKGDNMKCSFMQEVTPTMTNYWYLVYFYEDTPDIPSTNKRRLAYLVNNLNTLLRGKATLNQLELWAL